MASPSSSHWSGSSSSTTSSFIVSPGEDRLMTTLEVQGDHRNPHRR
jgi:hypothetical protein